MYKKLSTHTFNPFGFSAEILSAIKSAAYQSPTPIQTAAIPKILAGRDVLAGAETGSGKTAAFLLPVLHQLTQTFQGQPQEKVRSQQVRALILVPTRELALQISQEITKFSQNIEPAIKCLSVYGGVKIEQPTRALLQGVDFLVSTPKRFLDLIQAKAVKFNQLQVLILDEVDRLVEVAFKTDIDTILKYLPNKRQNLFFTATFPDEIRPLVRQVLNNPEIIKQDQQDKTLIDQRVLTVNFDQKTALLADLLNNNDWPQVLIFCSAKRTCDKLIQRLADKNISAAALHGNKKQHERRDTLKAFKAKDSRILVATDIAARGLDILQLPCVINYELPRSPNDYVHRIGRTGRAGQQGIAISLISHHEYQHFSVIEKRNGLCLNWEAIAGFEADEIAPPPPTRSKPKKKAKKKQSKKQIKRKRRETTSPEVLVDKPPYQPTEQPAVTSPYKTANNTPATPPPKPIPIPSAKPVSTPKATPEVTPEKPKINASIWGKQ
ncbi:MAG: DEAD/DEAH box helicase [Cocleimonas sp.]|nr:DEAD/DEAH box helicase [Cocleimonas sp.]